MVIKSLDLFTGVGMIAHALRGLGIEPAAYCEQDAMAIAVLRQRMRTGDLHAAPIHTDVAKFPGKDFRGKVQLIAGGFPCFPAGTPVLTDRGYMPIETVTGEEKLLTHTGSWKRIENLQSKLFSGRMASVSVNRQPDPIPCTDNHPFYARTLAAGPVWVAARDLTTEHYVGIPVDNKNKTTPDLIDNRYSWYAVTGVAFSELEDVWVYNFQVEDDHSYVVQNVVVKNCTGFSSVGGREGFDNPGSGLYKHIIRLVTEIQPNIVFLENVAAIRLDGLRHVAETLRSRGYDVSWISLRGFHVGAPQHRPRWFCLATKNGFSGTIQLKEPFKKYNWTKEPCARMVLDKTMTNERHALLGNSVIPDLVRWAFLYLWTGSCWPAAKVLSSKEWTFKKPDISKTIASKDPKEPPAIGMATAKNQVAGIVAPKGLLDLPKSRQIVLDPKKFTFTGPRNPNNTLEPHAAPVTVTTWATPRHGNTQPSRVLTLRCQRDLPTQIRFAACTPEHLRSGNPNPEFVEWLMGVPLGWTDPFGAVKKKQP